MQSRRINRLNIAFVDVLFAEGVSIVSRDVWREDLLHWTQTVPLASTTTVADVDQHAVWKVLDFGVVERIRHLQADLAEEDQEWESTGSISIELQRLDDDGFGLSEPVFREVSQHDGEQVIWHGWELEGCSPRRPHSAVAYDGAYRWEHAVVDGETNLAQIDPAETPPPCVMCGEPSIQIDAGGFGHCEHHIGENPPLPDEPT